MNTETPPDSSEASTPRTSGVERELPRGTTLGRFVVIGKLGQGGMGVVYAAYDNTLDRKVAVKVLRADRGGGSAERREALVDEGKILARLSHPNVVAVHDVGAHLDQVFLAMEFMGRGTLSDWLDKERSPNETVRMFLGAGAGLAAAHASGLVHRDFKPDNVLLDESGVPHVTDFGLARQVGAGDTKRAGTPGFMAPEQSRAGTVDARADQFAFCAALHLALYGKLPFPKGLDPQKPLPLLDPAPPGTKVPAFVRRVIFKGLAEDPNARFASMDELLVALSDDPARRRRSQLLSGLSFVSIGALVLVAAALLGRETSEERAVRECREGARSKVAAMWSPERRAAIEGAFAKASGGELFTRIDDRIGSEIGQWAQTAEAACVLPPADADRRRLVTCLEERRKTLQSLSDLFAAADPSVVSDAPNTVMLEVQPVSTCRTTVTNTERVLPLDSASDERMRSGLARARVLKAAGKYDDALDHALFVLDEAADTHTPRIEGEAELLAGELSSLMHRAEAKGYLEAALARAEVLGNDELRARAWIAMMVACLETKDCDVALASAQADALLEHLGRPALLEALRLNAVGMIALAQHELAVAETAFRSSLELREQHLPKDHPLVARSLNNLALTLPDDRRVPVLVSALALRRRVFGDNHPDTANAHHNLAEALVRIERCDEARGHFETAIGIWTIGPMPDAGRLGAEQASLAGALVCLGRTADAIASLKLAVENLKSANAPAPHRRRELELLLRLLRETNAPALEVNAVRHELETL